MRTALLIGSIAALSMLSVAHRTTYTDASAGPDRGRVSVAQVAGHAVEQMKLTVPGGTPFHLKARIYETAGRDSDRPNDKSDYKAEVEEYWIAPNKWRRAITSPDFSQLLVVNGDAVLEQDKGDYYPWWLYDLVTSIFDPLPMLDQLKQTSALMAQPSGDQRSTSCADFHTNIDRSVFCFQGDGVLAYVVARGYDAEFKDYKVFEHKRVARKIVIDPEPGTTIKAFVTEVAALSNPDESLFLIQQPTPPEQRLNRVQVDEDTIRKLAVKSDIVWPPVGGGLLKGRCAVYVSVDRTGRVREVWPQGCDNPGLQDTLREQVEKWQFNPALIKGVPTQVEGLLTFEFQTTMVSKAHGK